MSGDSRTAQAGQGTDPAKSGDRGIHRKENKPMGKDSVQIVDERTQETHEFPLFKGALRAMDLRKIKTGPDDFGMMTYDPAFMNTAVLPERDHVSSMATREFSAIAATRSNSSAEQLHLSGGRLPDSLRRTADRKQLKDWVSTDHASHDDSRNHQEVPGGLPPRRPSHGHVHQHGGGALHGLPGCTQRPRPRSAAIADLSADRQSAHHRRLCLPPQPGLTRTSIRTTSSATPRIS